MILKYLLFNLLSSTYAFISTKIISTPIFDNNQLSKFHDIVLFKKNKLINDFILEDIYCIDFSPNQDITNRDVIKKIILGHNIEGKVRIFYFNKITKEEIAKELDYNQKFCNINIIKSYDKDIYDIINNWNTSFNLYNHNCKHFSKYFVKSVNKIDF